MERAVKAQRPEKECHSFRFYQIDISFFVNSSHAQFTRSRNPQITKKVQNWLTQMEDRKARRPDNSFYQISAIMDVDWGLKKN